MAKKNNSGITLVPQVIPERVIMGYRATRRVWLEGRELKPDESQKVWNHSPDGFNWGYGGSGPAQLALAIMLKLTDAETAKGLYQRFKWQFVAGWPENFSIPVKEVEAWIQANKRDLVPAEEYYKISLDNLLVTLLP